jgi:hypothetical protein
MDRNWDFDNMRNKDDTSICLVICIYSNFQLLIDPENLLVPLSELANIFYLETDGTSL